MFHPKNWDKKLAKNVDCFKEHLADIWHNRDTPVAKHYLSSHKNNTTPVFPLPTILRRNAGHPDCTTDVRKNKETRQHSTQSVGNMPPPSPRHLLPHVPQIMPRNPKYDQFQPKGHHNEENPQSTTKMPVNPKFYLFHKVKIALKLEKSTNCNHNLITSESGQDTSACKISGHLPGNPKFDPFH